MAQDRDFLDDLIDISKGLDAIKNPLGDIPDQIMDSTDPDKPQWNPADYKEKPRANATTCLTCTYDKSSCAACLHACPVGAINIEEGGIDILDNCRKCGLCAAACPTESVFSPRVRPKKIYDEVARAATAYDTAYVTCTRALRRMPRENEVVLACVGDVTADVWFSLLAEYSNVSVYLPLDICTACRNTTGEEMLFDAIGRAEEWSGSSMGLEVDAKALRCHKRREYERKEFVDNVKKSTGVALTKSNPAASAVNSVSQKMRAHTNQISALEKALNKACGTTTQKRKRILTQGRKLTLTALQAHPELAANMQVSVPVCDQDKCTMCGECVEKCPTRAADIVGGGHLNVEPAYCVGCGLCVEVCEDHALSMAQTDGADLVIPDPEAEKKAAEAAKAKEDAEKAKAEAKKTINKALDQVEKLAD